MLTLRLNPSLEQRLEILSRRTGRAKSSYALQALAERLPEFERLHPAASGKDTARVRAAITSLKRLRRGVTKPAGMSVKQMKATGRA
jgi:predicted DNA-binding protein